MGLQLFIYNYYGTFLDVSYLVWQSGVNERSETSIIIAMKCEKSSPEKKVRNKALKYLLTIFIHIQKLIKQ